MPGRRSHGDRQSHRGREVGAQRPDLVRPAAPVRDRKGGIIGGVEIALDITKYKRPEVPVRELQPEHHELEAEVTADDPAEHKA